MLRLVDFTRRAPLQWLGESLWGLEHWAGLTWVRPAPFYGPRGRPQNLAVRFGPLYALLGFSGTGKSTLLKLFGCLLAPLEGEVHVPAGRTFGYVPQEPSLLPWLTIGRNLSLGAELLGDPATHASWRSELASKFALERFLDRRPSVLSGGMKQRTAVACALTSGANALLLDEPFAASDRVRKKAMFVALREFGERVHDEIILFTTHDVGDVFATGATGPWSSPEAPPASGTISERA